MDPIVITNPVYSTTWRVVNKDYKALDSLILKEYWLESETTFCGSYYDDEKGCFDPDERFYRNKIVLKRSSIIGVELAFNTKDNLYELTPVISGSKDRMELQFMSKNRAYEVMDIMMDWIIKYK